MNITILFSNSMKKIFYFVLVTFLGMTVLSSCSKKEEKAGPSEHEQFVASLTSADTTEVLNMCQDFFTKLSQGDKEGAIAMLSLSNDSGDVIAMTEEKIQQLTSQFTMFPVLDNHLVEYTFGEAADNLMKFKVIFAKDEDGKEEAINFGLNPIRKDGKWYLTVRNAAGKVDE